MGSIAEGLVGAKPATTEIDLVAFLDDIAFLVFDDIGAGDLVRAVFQGGDYHRIAHRTIVVRLQS